MDQRVGAGYEKQLKLKLTLFDHRQRFRTCQYSIAMGCYCDPPRSHIMVRSHTGTDIRSEASSYRIVSSVKLHGTGDHKPEARSQKQQRPCTDSHSLPGPLGTRDCYLAHLAERYKAWNRLRHSPPSYSFIRYLNCPHSDRITNPTQYQTLLLLPYRTTAIALSLATHSHRHVRPNCLCEKRIRKDRSWLKVTKPSNTTFITRPQCLTFNMTNSPESTRDGPGC